MTDEEIKNSNEEAEKKCLRVELVGAGVCSMEGFEAIWNIIRREQP